MKEEDIRPDALFLQYLSLAQQDAITYFKNKPYYRIACPACGSERSIFEFRKIGFDYEECELCKTLFVNPRPHSDAFSEFYFDSPSVRFWATNFYKETENSRRIRLIQPKALLVKDYIDKYYNQGTDESCIIDIGAGYGVFCEELHKILNKEISVIAIEPAQSLQKICREKGIITIPKFFEDLTADDLKGKKIVAATSFELLEHLHDPACFIEHCDRLLGQGSLLIMTTLNWQGFDLQVLREKSNSIFPPAHINFFTPSSLTTLLERHGFEICKLSTPGKLDVDIVTKQLDFIKDPFIRTIVSSDETVKKQFQIFLQKSNLSSHMMVVARKR
jgi:2-polyprenyl-3-methyl-5-hydroxy-6-metoxy-1,4-benzoquinol methylase